ncbi:MAG: O-antigen ligase family protein [Planctomycetaceae bacterium]
MIALLSLNQAGEWGSGAFFVALAAMALYSTESAFKALGLMWLGLMLNTSLVPKTLTWTPCRLALPYLAMARFMIDALSIRQRFFTQPYYVAFVSYCIAMAICSVISGWFTTIALFKLGNFWLTTTAILLGGSILVKKHADPGEWAVSLSLTGITAGCMAIALGVQNNLFRYGRLTDQFTGAFLHPNCHATYASLFVTFLAAVFVYSRYRHRWLIFPMAVVWIVFMTWSKSRTSFTATFAGMLILIVFGGSTARLAGWIRRSNVSRTTLYTVIGILGLTGIIYDLASGGALSSGAVGFINKGKVQSDDSSDTFLDSLAIVQSRRGLIDYSMKNFGENPVFGIGFQVAKTEEFARTATLFTAPAEKGFMPTALLEEGGVVGTTFFLIWIVAFLTTLLTRRNIPGLMVFAAFFMSSMTEVTLFSPGGVGGFGWVMVTAAMTFGEACWTNPHQSLKTGLMVDARGPSNRSIPRGPLSPEAIATSRHG